MGSISLTNVKFVGSHAGVSLGEDGASQMGLEDFAQFRSLIGSIVFYPSDAIACERAVELAANYKGTAYIRTSRPNSSVTFSSYPLYLPLSIAPLRQQRKVRNR